MNVETHEEGISFLDEWMDLYSHLVRRHSLSGIPAFSREAFRIQLTVPGLILFRACIQGRAVGMHLWYRRGNVAYSHLTALDPMGYRVGASFALHDAAIRHFARRVGWLDLGGGAGVRVATGDGLAAFKSGWSNEERPTFLCGRILNPPLYDELRRTASPTADYFPIYRAGEHSRFFGSRVSRGTPGALLKARMKSRLEDLALFGGSRSFEEALHVGRPNIGAREKFLERVAEIFDSRLLTNDGPMVREFETALARFLRVRHCVAACNATVALQVAARAAGMSGEVIVPPSPSWPRRMRSIGSESGRSSAISTARASPSTPTRSKRS